MNNEPVAQKIINSETQKEGASLCGIQRNGLRTPTLNVDRVTDPYFTIAQLNSMYTNRFQANEVS